ncbi:hypothetical protein CYMTET_17120, partial [Cymbomonas tetramitiformis]
SLLVRPVKQQQSEPAGTYCAPTVKRAVSSNPLVARLFNILGPCLLVCTAPASTFRRIHCAVLMLSGYSPPDAAALLHQDIARIRFAGPSAAQLAPECTPAPCTCSSPPHASLRLTPAWLDEQQAALALLDELDLAAVSGDAERAYAALHSAASGLLPGNNEEAASQPREDDGVVPSPMGERCRGEAEGLRCGGGAVESLDHREGAASCTDAQRDEAAPRGACGGDSASMRSSLARDDFPLEAEGDRDGGGARARGGSLGSSSGPSNASSVCLKCGKGVLAMGARAALHPHRLLYRAVLRGVGLLEREREYENALHYLGILVGLDAAAVSAIPNTAVSEAHFRYCSDLEHLGCKEEALTAATKVLATVSALTQPVRLALERACIRLSVPPRRWRKPVFRELREAPQLVVKHSGRVRDGTGGGKGWEDGSGARISVEGVVLAHYARESWRGGHTENGIFMTLFGILLWQEIFAPVHGGFLCHLQAASRMLLSELWTLLLDFTNLWTSRGPAIEARLRTIEHTGFVEFKAEVQRCWELHEGQQCRGVAWQQYNKHDLAEMAGCLGGKVVAGLLRVLAQDYDAWAGGMPDLFLYQPMQRRARLVEVKGPGDKLSDRQRVSIDYLLRLEADVWVAHVEEE